MPEMPEKCSELVDASCKCIIFKRCNWL